MERTVTTVIDDSLCTGCGLCVNVCPSETITMQDGKARVTGDQSLNCGHCMAVCPVEAVEVRGIDPSTLVFKTFNADSHWLAHGKYNPADLANLMLSRRSCRNYTDKPVNPVILEDLVKIGITAPSATNSQKWTFTLLENRALVVGFANRIGSFFKRLNKTAEKPFFRWLLKCLGKAELDSYYREYYESVKTGLEEWETVGTDILFHGAAAVIVVGSSKDAAYPKDAALLATQNILLAAHSMGLGTCLIGFAVAAMGKDKSIKRSLGIPDGEDVYAVIALGYPDETYERIVGRKKVIIRRVEESL